MNRIVLTAALAALALAGSSAEKPEANSVVAKRERNRVLSERFAPSCALMRIFFKRDAAGEPPAFRLPYYCPNCKSYHTESAESYLGDDRPLETPAFALAADRFLVQDFHLLTNWTDRLEVSFGGVTYAAHEVARHPQDEAVEIRTDKPVAGVKPLVFSKRIDFASDPDGVFFFSAKDNGLAVCGTRGNLAADFVRYGDIGKDVASAIGNAIAVNASNEAVTVSFRDKLPLDGQAFRPPEEWTREPAGAYAAFWSGLKDALAASTVPVYIHLDDEENRKDGWSRRYREYRSDSESTDLDQVGLVLPEGEVLVALDLDASKMSEIDKVEAHLAGGKKVPLEFVGALTEVKLAVFRFADGSAPAELKPARFDARRTESHYLEPAFLAGVKNYNGKSKVELERVRINAFETGRGGEAVPDVGSPEGDLGLLVYPDGTVGGVSARFRSGERWERNRLMTAARLQPYLAARDFDPQFAIRKGKDRVRIAWIGVETQRMTDELAREKKVSAVLAAANTRGALVSRVWTNSPAAKAGIAEGDILLNVRLKKSQRTRSLEGGDSEGFDWSEYFGSFDVGEEGGGFMMFGGDYSPWPDVEGGINRTFTDFGIGKAVVVAYVRGGVRREAEMTLEQAPVHYQTAKRVKNKQLGMIVSDLTFEVRGYFKLADDAPGVVIAKIQPANPAAIAGLRPLEIITHVNNEPVTGAKDFAKKVKGQKTLTFSVRRLAATRVVRIEVKEKKDEK